ncbi:Acetyltransferase (GNAT) domain-containing protein [Lentzea xinjiangensis]|uniref:Acetyltransferase (GNAT) domain-containing protein n=1 Tax=Lentzea xinjiangensis TaxID=402600 RepID=A0A1H9U1Q9_9PSEU|nr:GNAT family protein [Lentzea xinjiangensis]SES03376.1 Acetyltransferase (GNAT) domain-containing protein [Lentzea xinjiangensis]
MELVPLRKEFAQAMAEGGPHDDEVNRLTGTHQTYSLADYEAYVERTLNDPNRYTRAITEDGKYLGEVVLTINPHNRSAGMRIALWDGFGKGCGTLAIRHVLDHAFKERNLHRVDLEVYDFNERAIHVYKKLGFREEGRLRDALLWDGVFHDAIVMSILSTDNI